MALGMPRLPKRQPQNACLRAMAEGQLAHSQACAVGSVTELTQSFMLSVRVDEAWFNNPYSYSNDCLLTM